MRRQVNTVHLNNAPVQITWTDGGLNFLGDYDGGTTYAYGDVVTYAGSSYVALGATTGNLPTDTNFWQLLAITGVQGPAGPAGATGPTGPTGADGAQGDPGQGVPAAGTAGQVLMKSSAVDYDTEWYTFGHVPSGGTAAQVLVKDTGTDYDTSWADAHYVIAGGTTGQILTKLSDADYNLGWSDPPVDSGFLLEPISTTYADMLAAKGSWTPGQLYKYDFTTIHTIPYTAETNAGTAVTETIVVKAMTNDTLYRQVVSETYPQDYIEYEFEATRVGTAGDYPYGRITRRIDTDINVEAQEDWRNIVYRSWESSPGSGYYTEHTDNAGAYVDTYMFNNSADATGCYRVRIEHEGDSDGDYPTLSNNVFGVVYDTIISGYCHTNRMLGTTARVVARSNFYGNKIVNNCTGLACNNIFASNRLLSIQDSVIQGWCTGIYSSPEFSGQLVDSNIYGFMATVAISSSKITKGIINKTGGLSSVDISGCTNIENNFELTNANSSLEFTYDAGATSTIDIDSSGQYLWAGVVNLTFDNAEQTIDTYTITDDGRTIRIAPAAGKTAAFQNLSSGGDIVCNGDEGDYVEIEYLGGRWRATKVVN